MDLISPLHLSWKYIDTSPAAVLSILFTQFALSTRPGAALLARQEMPLDSNIVKSVRPTAADVFLDLPEGSGYATILCLGYSFLIRSANFSVSGSPSSSLKKNTCLPLITPRAVAILPTLKSIQAHIVSCGSRGSKSASLSTWALRSKQ